MRSGTIPPAMVSAAKPEESKCPHCQVDRVVARSHYGPMERDWGSWVVREYEETLRRKLSCNLERALCESGTLRKGCDS
jgi:hypothetical protein